MRYWPLVGILLLAFTLRVVGLSNHPAGFTQDEASFGYDAYSLLQTGKDQWGNPWPLSLKSFGDYKLPLYTYLAIPSVAVFGLNEFAVRLPNALLGTAAVLITYLLVRDSRIGASLKVSNSSLAILASLLLAISPWHVPMSRGAFESNLTAFFLPLGIWAFLKGEKNPKYYYLAALSFGLNMFSYHSARIVTPVLALLLVIFNRAKISKTKNAYLAFALFLLFGLVAFITLFQGGASRVSTSTIITPSGYANTFGNRFEAVLTGLNPTLATLVNNKVVYVINEAIQNYISYFSATFFWTQGPGEGTYGMMPGFGVLYWFESLFLIGFVLWVFSERISKKSLWLLAWLLLAPLPPAISIGPGYAGNRAAILLPAIHIASAIGGYYFYGLIRKQISPKLIGAAFSMIVLMSSIFFLEEYFYQQPIDSAEQMFYGVKEAMEEIASSDNEEIVISKRLSEAQIFVAFYHKIDPALFQEASKSWNFQEEGHKWVDQLPQYSLGKYSFRNIHLDKTTTLEGTTFVLIPEEYHEWINEPVTITYPSGVPAYYVLK